ncbi:hypothetical protein ACXZ65_34395 [Streptomyces aculeolatus]
MTTAASLSPRLRRLWALLRDRPAITTSDIHTANRRLGAPKRTTARADADILCRAGLLVEHGPTDGRWYEPASGTAQ